MNWKCKIFGHQYSNIIKTIRRVNPNGSVYNIEIKDCTRCKSKHESVIRKLGWSR